MRTGALCLAATLLIGRPVSAADLILDCQSALISRVTVINGLFRNSVSLRSADGTEIPADINAIETDRYILDILWQDEKSRCSSVTLSRVEPIRLAVQCQWNAEFVDSENRKRANDYERCKKDLPEKLSNYKANLAVYCRSNPTACTTSTGSGLSAALDRFNSALSTSDEIPREPYCSPPNAMHEAFTVDSPCKVATKVF